MTVLSATNETREGGSSGPSVGPAPPFPESVEDTGLSGALISDLIVKTLYAQGARSGRELSESIQLSFSILDEFILVMQQRRLLEVRGTNGHGRRGYVFDLTGEGRTRAREMMETNAYVGPAPIPYDVYREWVELQSVTKYPVEPHRIHGGLDHMVLNAATIDRLGAGINSGRSVFLYGDAGNGKTEVAFALADILGTTIYVPYAVEIEGQIIQVYDPLIHNLPKEVPGDVTGPGNLLHDLPPHDLRYVQVRRPTVVVGGELTLDQLDLGETPMRGVFVAPPQMKANGGIFVIDDFGRQRVHPRDLLNRWMIPLDRRVDFLGLPTGHKLEVPFDCLIFFATNLDPADLVEEAFLRRIRHKIYMPSPNRQQFAEILRRVCEGKGIRCSEEAVADIFQFYHDLQVEPRSCHPRDLVADICDHARYRGIEPFVGGELLKNACASYFIGSATVQSKTPTSTPVESQGVLPWEERYHG